MTTDTPVCMIVFNRPGKARRVLEAVRNTRPGTLVVIADGPREGCAEDEARCDEVRRLIEARVDWPCEVVREYADTNLGCFRRTVSGLDRVFRDFESAIILEDDCLPDATFFPFCRELLARYRDDPRVSMISGNNFHRDLEFPSSYYFSRIHNIWGWATWRDRWQDFDPDMRDWPAVKAEGGLADIVDGKKRIAAWTALFDYAYRAKAWDFAWMFEGWRQSRFAVVPSCNLVTNIGYGAEGTHMRDPNHPQANVPRREMGFPLVHPTRLIPYARADRLYELIIFPDLRPAPEEATGPEGIPKAGVAEAPETRHLPAPKKFLRLRAFVRGILMLFLPRSWLHGSISERIRTKLDPSSQA